MRFFLRFILSGVVFCDVSDAFVHRSNSHITFAPPSKNSFSLNLLLRSPTEEIRDVTLFAKKKKGKGNTKSAALDALDALEADLDTPLSKKELKALEKKKKKEAAAAAAAAASDTEDKSAPTDAKSKPLSKKEKMLAKALELEMDAVASQADDYETPKLSKKELKALRKKEGKLALKGKKES